MSTSEPSLVWSLERGNDDVLLQGQFYSDRTRVVNCQYDRMSNHTKIHQEDVWLWMNGWNSKLTMSGSGAEVGLTLQE